MYLKKILANEQQMENKFNQMVQVGIKSSWLGKRNKGFLKEFQSQTSILSPTQFYKQNDQEQKSLMEALIQMKQKCQNNQKIIKRQIKQQSQFRHLSQPRKIKTKTDTQKQKNQLLKNAYENTKQKRRKRRRRKQPSKTAKKLLIGSGKSINIPLKYFNLYNGFGKEIDEDFQKNRRKSMTFWKNKQYINSNQQTKRRKIGKSDRKKFRKQVKYKKEIKPQPFKTDFLDSEYKFQTTPDNLKTKALLKLLNQEVNKQQQIQQRKRIVDYIQRQSLEKSYKYSRQSQLVPKKLENLLKLNKKGPKKVNRVQNQTKKTIQKQVNDISIKNDDNIPTNKLKEKNQVYYAQIKEKNQPSQFIINSLQFVKRPKNNKKLKKKNKEEIEIQKQDDEDQNNYQFDFINESLIKQQKQKQQQIESLIKQQKGFQKQLFQQRKRFSYDNILKIIKKQSQYIKQIKPLFSERLKIYNLRAKANQKQLRFKKQKNICLTQRMQRRISKKQLQLQENSQKEFKAYFLSKKEKQKQQKFPTINKLFNSSDKESYIQVPMSKEKPKKVLDPKRANSDYHTFSLSHLPKNIQNQKQLQFAS